MSEATVEEPEAWESVADFESWWRRNVRALNRLAVADPEEWERITRIIEGFQWRRNNGRVF